jgi:hypothetical protein
VKRGKFRDVVTSHLREDTRILASVLATRRIYSDPMYDIFLCIYSGLMDSNSLNDDLVTCLIVFKEEELRLMFKLWTDQIEGERNAYIEAAVRKLEQEGKGPMHLVRDAKTWCHVPFTLRDRAALRMRGIDLPRPPKESW